MAAVVQVVVCVGGCMWVSVLMIVVLVVVDLLDVAAVEEGAVVAAVFSHPGDLCMCVLGMGSCENV